jgi:hypothetical protein
MYSFDNINILQKEQ